MTHRTDAQNVTVHLGTYWWDGQHWNVQDRNGAWHSIECGEPFCPGCYDP